MKAALSGSPLSLYGDGRQIRDILFIDDLVAAFERARLRSGRVAGEIYNIGGGPGRTLSLRELIAWIERDRKPEPAKPKRNVSPHARTTHRNPLYQLERDVL